MELPTLADRNRSHSRKTEVGSYFVANYPPFSVWSPEHLPAIQHALDTPPEPDDAAGAVPAHSVLPQAVQVLLLPRLHRQERRRDRDVSVGAVARDRAVRRPRRACRAGSSSSSTSAAARPRYLSQRAAQAAGRADQRQLALGRGEGSHVRVRAGHAQGIEAPDAQGDRRHAAEPRRRALQRRDPVASTAGRTSRRRSSGRTTGSRNVGFPQINIDLIAGMVGETEDKWKDAGREGDRARPGQRHDLPDGGAVQHRHRQGRPRARRRVAPSRAGRRSGRGSITRSSSSRRPATSSPARYTLVKPERHAGFVYRDSLWRGADLVGTGVASFGHFQGVHYQNLDTWETYIEKLDARRAAAQPRAAGQRPPAADPRDDPAAQDRQARRRLLPQEVRRRDPRRVRARASTSLVDEGFATIDGDEVRLTREGLLQVDTLLPRFFEPEHRGIRYT